MCRNVRNAYDVYGKPMTRIIHVLSTNMYQSRIQYETKIFTAEMIQTNGIHAASTIRYETMFTMEFLNCCGVWETITKKVARVLLSR